MRMFDIISKKKYNESLSKEEIDYVLPMIDYEIDLLNTIINDISNLMYKYHRNVLKLN